MIEFAVIVVAAVLIVGVVWEVARITLERDERRHDADTTEILRRRYGPPRR